MKKPHRIPGRSSASNLDLLKPFNRPGLSRVKVAPQTTLSLRMPDPSLCIYSRQNRKFRFLSCTLTYQNSGLLPAHQVLVNCHIFWPEHPVPPHLAQRFGPSRCSIASACIAPDGSYPAKEHAVGTISSISQMQVSAYLFLHISMMRKERADRTGHCQIRSRWCTKPMALNVNFADVCWSCHVNNEYSCTAFMGAAAFNHQ